MPWLYIELVYQGWCSKFGGNSREREDLLQKSRNPLHKIGSLFSKKKERTATEKEKELRALLDSVKSDFSDYFVSTRGEELSDDAVLKAALDYSG